METARELFIHEVNDVLDAERKILEALEENEKQSQRPELKKLFSQHYDQTEGQVERLEQVLEELGEEPESVVCHGIVGIIEEKHSTMEEQPSEELVDIINTAGSIKVEHYEIASYEGLIQLAQQLGLRKVVKPLQQSLREEQQTLKKLQAVSKKLKPSQTGMEGMEEEQNGRGRQQQRRAGSSRGRSSRGGRAA